MASFFWICLLLGGGVALLQLGATLFGFDHDGLEGDADHGHLSEGFEFLSVRSLSAGIAFFGLGGVAAMRFGLPGILAAVVGLIPGAAAAAAVSYVMRSIKRLEADRSVRLDDTIGQVGDVYLSIPAGRSGMGKVHLTAKERLTELDAMTPGEAIEAGTRILVTDAIPPATVIVVPQPRLLDDGDA